MKILFLLALLVNIIFFLWESNSESSNVSSNETDANATKQILLQSELAKDKVIIDITNAENKTEENTKTLPVKPSIKELVEAKSKKIDKGITTQKESVLDAALSIKKDSVIETKTPEKQTVVKSEQNDRLKNDEVLKINQVNQVTASPSLVASLSSKKDIVLDNETQDIRPVDKPKKNKIKKAKEPNNNQATNSTAQCYEVGPFENADSFNIWRQLNKIDPASFTLLNKDSDVLRQYMVYYPAAENIEEANENVNKIKEAGITDLWLFTKGKYKWTVSLGLYDREAPALAFIEKLAKIAIKAEIKPIDKTKSVIYSRVLTMNKDFKETASLSDKQKVIDCEGKL